MNGDFTRVTFDQDKHYTSVLLSQGRVLLDADWNEQAAILLHYLQTLATDLIGPYGGPGSGFEIDPEPNNGDLVDLNIGDGHYYVDGILCENKTWTDAKGKTRPTYYIQPDYIPDPKIDSLTSNFLVYLDVWERLITSYEDSGIREVALGGPDTAARAKVVWQVRTENDLGGDDLPPPSPSQNPDWKQWISGNWNGFVEKWQPENRGMLKAKAKEDATQNLEACAVPPGARYRGVENQLYRVEIHRGGKMSDQVKPTFKWSRDNGSVIFPIRKLEGTIAYLDHLGYDDRQTLKKDDWVEVVDDSIALFYEPNNPGTLAQVVNVDPLDMTVTLKTPNGDKLPTYAENSPNHPLLRRWDYSHYKVNEDDIPEPANDGALLIKNDTWLILDNGIQIYFEGSEYRTGDYWLIPARTATGDIEWPQETDDNGEMAPKALSPQGITHHYAPLAVVVAGVVNPVRNVFCPVPLCPEDLATPSSTRRG